MAFTSRPVDSSIKRAVVYLRVSTGKQALGEVSIPSQRELTRRHCETQGWTVVDEYVEPGASATDDRRPVFQRMLEDARSPERGFDVICVHAFSRFYRNGAEMELTIRHLHKLGVEVVSVTQPTGDDPSQQLMRQIIGIFDEYTSKENGKNVVRAMRESAKQGFWNGSKPPLGYKAVEAERRGSKIKKRLTIDPVDAETVRLIFRLYLEGDGASGPLGIKNVVKWLNSHGYRTRMGATFGVGPLHGILTNRAYATGKWPYGVRNARTGVLNDPDKIVEIDIPPIIALDVFERTQARLAHNNPRVTPPRVVNGPLLLTGLAICASCGSGMTMTGTRRRGRNYVYYSCAGCQLRGKGVCKGRHIPMAKLDELVIRNVKEKLLQPERLSQILAALIERRAAGDKSVVERREALQTELGQVRDKLSRLYAAIEDGVVTLDADLKDRIAALNDRRTVILGTLERVKARSTSAAQLTPMRIETFGALLRRRLSDGDLQARKAYLRSVISRIEVDDQKIRIVGDKGALADVVAGRASAWGQVRGFERKWRPQGESNPCFSLERAAS